VPSELIRIYFMCGSFFRVGCLQFLSVLAPCASLCIFFQIWLTLVHPRHQVRDFADDCSSLQMEAAPVPLALIGTAITLPANVKSREELFQVIKDKRQVRKRFCSSQITRIIQPGKDRIADMQDWG